MFIIKLLINMFYWVLAIVVLVFAVGLLLTKQDNQWGVRAFHVETGSMTPALPIGSLVVVKKQSTYQANDIVTFKTENNDSFVTHRVVSVVDTSTPQYITKGDANKTVDPEPLDIPRVVGKVLMTIPYLGIPMRFVRTQTGFILLIVVPATIIAYSELVNIKNEIISMWNRRREKKNLINS